MPSQHVGASAFFRKFPRRETQLLIDPVCGKRIKRQRAHIAIDYRGVTYYLCCPRCQADFERAPEKFARPEVGETTKSS
ncbi:MAG: YHS domain-containing protein, partial [Chloroflexi bacterium]|nr:YHS domain-containing protein [Chloroflexota bacterium]